MSDRKSFDWRFGTARASRLAVVGVAVLALSGCATTTPPVAVELDPDLAAAARFLANDLARQLSPWTGERSFAIDPLLDRGTGQQTGVSRRLEEALSHEMSAAIPGLAPVRFDRDQGDGARLVLAGTVLAREVADRYSVSVALTDRQSGLVIAQSVTRFREAGLDRSPTEFYRDSPSLVRDRSVEAYVTTSTTPAGRPADPLYVEQLSTAAVLAAALEAYNKGEWETALDLYEAAGSRPDGHQLRTLNGVYLGNVRLGRLAAAEEAFGRIASFGLETNNLAVKLLFRPGTTEFWPGAEFGNMYPVWLRQIARAAQMSKRCLNVVGHTSRTGSEAFNDTLSLNRAEAVKRILVAEVPGLASQLRASGVGFRENIIGTGADDASDALDRRVEFRVVSCTPGSG